MLVWLFPLYLEREAVFAWPVYLEALLATVEHSTLAPIGAEFLTIETLPLRLRDSGLWTLSHDAGLRV